MVLSQEQAESIARDWVAAWNKRDLESVLRHYDGDVQFVSPRVVSSYKEHQVGSKDGLIRGLACLARLLCKGHRDTGGKAPTFAGLCSAWSPKLLCHDIQTGDGHDGSGECGAGSAHFENH
eukprot:jgi/Botrbrau1/4967/Bobra.0122s0042.1